MRLSVPTLVRIAAGAGLGFLVARLVAYRVAERALIVPLANGSETPSDCGLDGEVFTFASGMRELHAHYVRPSVQRDVGAAVLIFHGTHEAISQWVPAQGFLAEHGIGSMVFDYSGFGESTGGPTFVHLRHDVQAAWHAFSARTNPGSRRYLLGYSLGTGMLLGGARSFGGAYDGVVLIAGFTSARDASVTRGTVPRWLAFVVPDLCNNQRMVQRLRCPLLVVHSVDDTRLPLWMAERVYAAANEPKRLVVLNGLPHNGIVHGQAAEYLAPAVDFMVLGGLHGRLRGR